MSARPDPLPPGEVASDELEGSAAVSALTRALDAARQCHADLKRAIDREPVMGLPKACPEYLLTDCQFEERRRGSVLVIKVREPLTISAEKVLRVRVSRAWLRVLRARLNGMDL